MTNKINTKIKALVLAAMFLAIGMVLPLITMQIKEIGDTLLPMHFPVLLCGFLCGWHYGATVGLILPFLRPAIFGMPPIFPNAIWMATELMTYGLVAGIMYSIFKSKNMKNIYISLITAQISGRIVWGITKALLLFYQAKPFGLMMFLTGGFLDAIPGIIIQLILIPVILNIANKRSSN